MVDISSGSTVLERTEIPTIYTNLNLFTETLGLVAMQ